MHLRRTLAVAATALALATTLSSCGFSPATNRVYTPAAGPINREATVDVLSAMIVSKAPGAGTFIAGLSNNSGSETITFDAIRPVNNTTITFDDLEPREIPPLGFENLSEPGNGIEVTGDFTAGDVVTLDLTFSTGETASLGVPVVKPCFQYTQVPTPDAGDAPGKAGEEAGEAADEEAHAEESHGDEAHAEEGGDATFNCADEAPAPEGAH